MEKSTKTARVLKKLQTAQTVTNWELNKISFRYGSCIHDLRKEGHVIKTNRINNDGLYEYSYHGLTPEAEIEKRLADIKANPKEFERGLLGKIKEWL